MSEQYTYAVARIRALEVSLFSDSRDGEIPKAAGMQKKS